MLGAVSDKAALVSQAWTVRLPSTLEGGRGWLNASDLDPKMSNLFEGGGSRFVFHMLAQSLGLLDISCCSIFHGPRHDKSWFDKFY